MSKATYDESQQTKWPDPPSPDAMLAPRHGWDNPPDVREAIRLCKEAAYGLSANSAGQAFAARLAMRLHQQGIHQRTARRLILEFSQPQLSEADISLIIADTYDAAANEPGVVSLARAPNPEPNEDEDDWGDDGWMEGGLLNVWPRPLVHDVKQNNAKILDGFLEHRPGKIISSDGVLYSLDADKVWREVTEDAVAAEIRATDPSLSLDTARIRQMVRALHVERHTTARPFEWITEPTDAPLPADCALFSNGVLDVTTGTLHPHTGALFATGFPDFDYDPAATCPTWDRCLGEWLHPSYHGTLMEFIGYAMTPDTSAHAMLALIGVKRGGKSTVLHVLSWLVGAAHTTARTLHDLATDFGLEGLTDKKLVIVPDASDTDINRRAVALDRIKAISGGDEVSVNRKGLRIVSARVPARLAIAANRHPKFLDDSGALAAREVLIVFERSFIGNEDRDLGEKLRDELPGIANAALAALRRLRANGLKFSIGAKGAAASRDLAESQSPALRFAKACLIVTGDVSDRVSLPDAFEAYEAWSAEESLSSRERRNRNDFKNDLIAALGAQGVRHGRRRWHDPTRLNDWRHGNGVIKRGFFGVKLRTVPSQ